MRLEAQSVLGQKSFTKLGTLSSYNPKNYTGKVLIQPEEIETGFLPILSSWVGNSWGLFTPPSLNDVVIIHFFDGNFENGCISLCNFNNVNPPLSVNSGEFWIVHKSGSFLKFTNDGNVAINANENLNITINGSNGGAVNITGNVNITGSIVASGDITDRKDSMENIRTIYNGHQHAGSPVPDQQMPT